MAGHSKWNNIKRRKGAQDQKRAKVFTRISKEIHQAARNGGDNLETNAALKMAVDKAKQANMPNDNIERTIQKAVGNVEGVSYEEVTYEGYAPHGAAVFVEVLTENRNRSAAEVRLAFNKNGGNLGADGCVSFMFQRKGYLLFEKTADVDEEELLLDAIEAGAEDVVFEEEVVEIFTAMTAFHEVKEALGEPEGLRLETSELTMIPDTTTPLDDAQAEDVVKLLEALEDCDDVQHVAHNAEL
ncbi:YebC/PmpR family DNA-binding transcriptional regulator [Alkalicoccus chagannorensis]|uniref:YebC/PmpR family DNA-binding transcriptional regulator n=1 Tax=Alkalicoccus chagannorensis TaxID=427072 RepID=UPI00041F27A4|nr:YebC/PmpR family DNA-binding transcriptional regulator [Alkalicoccus chagannorensis]